MRTWGCSELELDSGELGFEPGPLCPQKPQILVGPTGWQDKKGDRALKFCGKSVLSLETSKGGLDGEWDLRSLLPAT